MSGPPKALSLNRSQGLQQQEGGGAQGGEGACGGSPLVYVAKREVLMGHCQEARERRRVCA